MKSTLKTKRAETTYAIYVEHFKSLAQTLAKPIIEKYKKRCRQQGSPLGYMGEKAIERLVLEKMVVTATVKVTMKELDKLFPKKEM